MHLGARQAAQPAFEPGDYHDLLAEMRANFLVDGEEESGRLLGRLAQGLDLDRVQRTVHHWTGIAGMLGFAEIARKARGIEDYLADPGERRRSVRQTRAMIAAGECVSRLRVELLAMRQLFSQAVSGRRETPDLPPVVREMLGEKSFAVIGFEAAEAARITRALEHARARCRTFQDLPDNDTLQPFHAGVVNVCQGEGIFSWVNSEVASDSPKPILFVGSAETSAAARSRDSRAQLGFPAGAVGCRRVDLQGLQTLYVAGRPQLGNSCRKRSRYTAREPAMERQELTDSYVYHPRQRQ